jgi:SAM-dependent methyltransferase
MKNVDPTVATDVPSEHYRGSLGVRYFEWQNRNAHITGRIEARKFRSHISSGDVVLDFGCGGGHVLGSVKCARRLGVEVNPAARAEAVKQGIECYESLLEVPDGCIDVAISNHALEHVHHPIGVLKELRKKLKGNGILILCLPIDDWRVERHFDPSDINHHLHTWTSQLLGNSLCEAGFQPEKFSIRVLTHAWFPGTVRVFDRMPERIFDVLCYLYSVLVKRRQLIAAVRT